MTEPDRGIVRPVFAGALTGLVLVCAVAGWLERKSRPAVRNCGNHPRSECFERCRTIP